MTLANPKWLIQKAIAVLLVPCVAGFAMAQTEPQPPPPADSSTQLLSPQQLDNLVAPVALYPDPLLAQVFAAATYPLEIVELQQWLQDHRDLRGQQLVDAAKQQNWDPSVQAMVAFPDAIAMLTRDIRWTTDLGNAFLAQQADVMAAVQRMRGRAQSNGRLQTNQQQTVTTENQGGDSAIDIEPTDPQVVYVPTYNPAYVWGPPAYGYYPPLWYPSYGFGWGAPCFLGGFFAGVGFGLGLGWGWGFGWFGHSLFVNGLFFNHYGFGGYGRGWGAREAWAHNSYHRLGVPYANRNVANRFGGAARSGFSGGARSGFSGAARSGPAEGGWRSFNGSSSQRGFSGGASRGFEGNNNYRGSSNYGGQSRSFAPANRAPAQSYSGQSYSGQRYSGQSYGGQRSAGQSFGRSYSGGAQQHYSAPRSSGSFGGGGSHYSAPRSSGGGGGGGHYSAPHSSGGGGHSSGGGGHSSSGGGHRR